MELLEREQFLAELFGLFKEAENGNGQIATVCGEAGIGKTSLVESFTQQLEGKANIFWGVCDDLYTPRPLAPLYDIANQLSRLIVDQLDSGIPRPSIFTNLIKEIQLHEPNVLVIEDIHWADESTFDLIKFLGRRINKCRTIFIITYRDDEIKSDHPLKISLSSIPSKYFKRIKLNPLSNEAVMKLASIYGKQNVNVYDKTGGNPFLVTELLSNTEKGVPANVSDLINSKLIRLSDEARNVVELISVIPNRADKWLLTKLAKDLSVVDEAIHYGILKTESDAISFRHELARMSVEESLTEAKRINLNSLVLNVLLEQKNINPFLARIIHHSNKTNNYEVIAKYAPLAAKQASKLGAHIQASKHYLSALQHASQLSTDEHLRFLEGRAYECYLTGQIEEGIKTCESIIEIMKDYPDPLREGENYRRLSRLMWYAGEDAKGEEYLKKAIEIFEGLREGKQLAMAYSNLSQVYMCREETEPAVEWGKKAIELAKEIKDLDIEAHALCNIGSAKMFAEDDSGENYMKKTLELSLQNDFHDHASRAYANIGSAYLYRRNLTEAEKYFSIGKEYCNEKDLYTHGLCISAEISKTKLYAGKWDEAIEHAGIIFKHDNVPVIDKVVSLCVIGIIRARRNDPGAMNLLEEANILALKSGELMKIVTAESAIAEAYWLKNKLSDIVKELKAVYNKIKDNNNPWAVGEIAFWLWKAGDLSEIPERIAKPFLLQIKGDWKSAEKLWEELKCPYEQALALSDGDEKATKKAVEIFDHLGASAPSQLVKQKMRESGIKKIPKGPRQSTKENPAGLTKRQLEVLKLLADGLSNSEIGNNLYISSKTVDHHISAIFSKLNIHSRTEAAAFVYANLQK